MCIHAPPPDHIPPWGRQAHTPEAREHRTREQDRRADPGGERRIDFPRLGPARVHFDAVRPGPLHRRPEVREQREHGLDIADVRHIFDPARPVGEERGRENGKGSVLVAGGANAALERAPARYREARRHG